MRFIKSTPINELMGGVHTDSKSSLMGVLLMLMLLEIPINILLLLSSFSIKDTLVFSFSSSPAFCNLITQSPVFNSFHHFSSFFLLSFYQQKHISILNRTDSQQNSISSLVFMVYVKSNLYIIVKMCRFI